MAEQDAAPTPGVNPYGFDAVPKERLLPVERPFGDRGDVAEFANHLLELENVELVGQHAYCLAMANAPKSDLGFWAPRHGLCDAMITARNCWDLIDDEE